MLQIVDWTTPYCAARLCVEMPPVGVALTDQHDVPLGHLGPGMGLAARAVKAATHAPTHDRTRPEQ